MSHTRRSKPRGRAAVCNFGGLDYTRLIGTDGAKTAVYKPPETYHFRCVRCDSLRGPLDSDSLFHASQISERLKEGLCRLPGFCNSDWLDIFFILLFCLVRRHPCRLLGRLRTLLDIAKARKEWNRYCRCF